MVWVRGLDRRGFMKEEEVVMVVVAESQRVSVTHPRRRCWVKRSSPAFFA